MMLDTFAGGLYAKARNQGGGDELRRVAATLFKNLFVCLYDITSGIFHIFMS